MHKPIFCLSCCKCFKIRVKSRDKFLKNMEKPLGVWIVVGYKHVGINGECLDALNAPLSHTGETLSFYDTLSTWNHKIINEQQLEKWSLASDSWRINNILKERTHEKKSYPGQC